MRLSFFLCVFALFSEDFKGSAKEENPRFFRGSSLFYPKKNKDWSYDPAGLLKSTKSPETQKYEKLRKKGWGPKIRKKYQKNSQFVIFGPLLYFSVFFSYFWGPTMGGGFCIFFVIFLVFLGFRALWALYQARGIVRLEGQGIYI